MAKRKSPRKKQQQKKGAPEWAERIASAVTREAKQKKDEEARRRKAAGFAGLRVPSDGSKKNIYVCDRCFGHIVTTEKVEGTTPFMLECKVTPDCMGVMESSFYRVFDQRMKATFEWYVPDEKDGLSRGELDHVEKGGLLLRPLDHE